MSDVKLVDKAVLKKLIPANALNVENFQELASKARLEEVAAGKVIFKKGETDRKTIYLLEGDVIVSAGDGAKIVSGGTDVARHPLDNHQPRQTTVTAKTNCTLTKFDSDLLDILLTWDQLSGIEVNEIQVDEDGDDEGGDWMTRILQSQAFLQVPPANIQAMFMRMQEVPVRAGDTIIEQGGDGDFYYIITNGQAKVTRASKTGSELKLATLNAGDAFGEEALLSDSKRNANIIMTENGSLMRLSKEDFNELLKEPMLSWVTYEEAEEIIREENGKWLDVRLETEHQNTGLEGSINIPLFMLRMKADSMDPEQTYIVYCDTGRRSSAAAFLLSERGFNVCVLKGGLIEAKPS